MFIQQLDKHQTSKPMMVSCELNQILFLVKPFKTPRCQLCTEISNLRYLRKYVKDSTGDRIWSHRKVRVE